MIHKAKKVTVEQYKEHKGLNQSLLKNIQFGINYFNKKLNEETELDPQWAKIGSAVDCILTEGEDEFQNQFYVSNLKKLPSETEIQIIKSVWNQVAIFDDSFKDLDKYTLYILAAVNDANYQSRWKDDTRINKIIENCTDYWNDLKAAAGKTVLTVEESDIIRSAINRVEKSPIYSEVFSSKDYEIYYQFPIYFKYNDIDCKGLIDIMHIKVDSDNKELHIKLFDIKTTSSSLIDFEKSIYKFRYDIQAMFYILGIKSIFGVTEYPGYKVIIDDFSFVVVSTNEESLACIYTLTDNFYTEIYNNDRYKYLSLTEMLDLYKYHYVDHQETDNDKIIIDNKFHLYL